MCVCVCVSVCVCVCVLGYTHRRHGMDPPRHYKKWLTQWTSQANLVSCRYPLLSVFQ